MMETGKSLKSLIRALQARPQGKLVFPFFPTLETQIEKKASTDGQ